MQNQYISYLELPQKLDLREDDTVLICSDITKVAINAMRHERSFNPQLFINGFKQKINLGTLLFPAFISDLKNGDTFDIINTLPQTGSLSIAAFKDVDFVRTSDPFHSFMVWGKYSDKLKAINSNSTFGEDSVFSFLHNNKGKMLLIDIDLQHSFTFAHYVEEKEKVKYRKFKKYNLECISADNIKENKDVLFYEKRKGVMINLNGLHQIFKEKGVLKEVKLNDSLFTIIDLEKSVDVIKSNIHLNNGRKLYNFSYTLWIKAIIKSIISIF